MNEDCVFCQIVRREAAANIVHQDEQVTAFRDLRPAAPVHILIVPNRHIESLEMAGEGDEALLGHLLTTAHTLAGEEGVGESGYRVVLNSGRRGGQRVFHLHLHLLGGRPLGWPPG